MELASRQAWIMAGVGLVLLCAAFTPEIGAAVRVWNQSTAYGHCWLVLPIAGWLLWERRAVVAGGVARPTAWPALAAVPVALVWVASDWLGIMEGRQLALVAFAELLLMAAFGVRLWWALSAAFLYLVFLVPFGAFLTPALQHFTTNFILAGLRVLDIPFDADAFQITIPEGAFYVAEACAGLRFLIASVAFGVLYAVTIFRSPWRRAAFIAVACVVPVVANGFRGLGIVVLGHVLGSAEAGAADHLIYGWVFFSFVIVLLALGGLPFREDFAAAGVVADGVDRPARGVVVMACCAAVLVVGLAGPLSLLAMDAPSPAVVGAVMPQIALPDGCVVVATATAGAARTQIDQCGAARLRVIATAVPPASNPARIIAAGRDSASAGMVGEIDSQVWHAPSGAAWVLLTTHEQPGEAAYAVFFDGAQMAGGLRDRVRMARGMWGHQARSTVALAVRLEPGSSGTLRAFLGGMGPQGLLF